MCVFRVLQVLESGLADYGVTLGRLEKHYRVCLSADASGRKDAAAATLLHSQVRPTAVQGLLACGVKNAQSASAAREHLDRVYRTSGHRQATDGILKGISVCTGCVEAPERPPSALVGTEAPGPELHGVPLAALKGQHPLGERRRPPPSLASLAAEDLVDMSTDDLKERYKRTVTMAGMMFPPCFWGQSLRDRRYPRSFCHSVTPQKKMPAVGTHGPGNPPPRCCVPPTGTGGGLCQPDGVADAPLGKADVLVASRARLLAAIRRGQRVCNLPRPRKVPWHG